MSDEQAMMGGKLNEKQPLKFNLGDMVDQRTGGKVIGFDESWGVLEYFVQWPDGDVTVEHGFTIYPRKAGGNERS